MSQNKADLFTRDLKYLVEPKAKHAKPNSSSHSHWLATAVITVLVGVWIGRDPNASVGVDIDLPLKSQEVLSAVNSASKLSSFSASIPTAPSLTESVVGTSDEKRTLNAQLLSIPQADRLIEKPQSVALSGIDFGPHTTITGLNQHPVSQKDLFPSSPAPNDVFDYEPKTVSFDDIKQDQKIESFEVKTNLNLGDYSTYQDKWVIIDIKAGDTLGKIFKNYGIDSKITHKVSRSKQGSVLNNLQTGPNLRLRFNKDKQLVSLRYNVSPLKILVTEFDNEQNFKTNFEARKIELVEREASGTIKSSLFASAAKSGVSDQLVLQLASIFKWNIDFSRDLQEGDKFSLIYEEKYIAGKKFSNGGVLAAAFEIGDSRYTAIRDVDSEGNVSYYSVDGNSLKRAFLRSPVEFSRISSQFSKKRFHPVLKKWRAHNGVDYAASRGTPVTATADGIVTFKGHKGGYGRAVMIQHGKKYQTLYGHLNSYSKKIKSGGRIKQGQVLGYVGSSGLASGPHLHYEFRVNGIHKNPLTVKVPRALPIAGGKREKFLRTAKLMNTRLLATN
jgi:murein DD-endopeptidase MepM/ murein hydrolase activator NlpD